MTGLWVLVAAVALTLAFGGYRRLTDGRARAQPQGQRLAASELGAELGAQASLVQFSSSVCAPCRTTHRLLADISAGEPSIAHLDIDAETRLDLVRRFDVTRTPTVLVLDGRGVVRGRINGAPRRPEVLEALQLVTGPSAA